MRLFLCFLCLCLGSALPARAQALKGMTPPGQAKSRSTTPFPGKPLYGEKTPDLKPVLIEEKTEPVKSGDPSKKKEAAPKKSSESASSAVKATRDQEAAAGKTGQSEKTAPAGAEPVAKSEQSETKKKSTAPRKKEPVLARKKSVEKKPSKTSEPEPPEATERTVETTPEPVRKAEPVLAKAPEPAPGGSAATPPIPGAAVFRPGDVFELRLSGMPAEDALPFALQFTIGTDGFVNVPLGGLVRAEGLTQSQLESAIEKRLVEKEIFTRPTATINVAPQSRFVTVGGQVRVPQRLPWTADLTLLSAISAVGGPADFAGGKIKLTRSGKVEVFSKKDLDRHPEKDPRLFPGDQIEQL